MSIITFKVIFSSLEAHISTDFRRFRRHFVFPSQAAFASRSSLRSEFRLTRFLRLVCVYTLCARFYSSCREFINRR